MANSSSSSSAPHIMDFRPTMEEFKDFSKYIEKIESLGTHKAGWAKIIPPEGWCPRKGGYDDIDLMIPAPISQIVNGREGLYQQYSVQQKATHVLEFKKMAESSSYRTPSHSDYKDIERQYWKNITFVPPIYGADVSGSLYDEGVEEFNIQRLNTILDMVNDDYEVKIEGVNTAYLYFGMWKTTFAWHTEDMDLYSINYLHYGAPKSWYVVPPEHGRRLERMAAQFFHRSSSSCSAFLRHKMTIISPHVLKKYSIPFSKITQEPGEFMITFPFAYHAGFNHGFNIAESTNFALPRWVEYGKRSSQCSCSNDSVKICMDVFVHKFQPEHYELWKAGKDYGYHPEDPNKYYAAPAPNKMELAMSIKKQEEKKKLKNKVKQRSQPVTRLRKKLGKVEPDSDKENEKLDEAPKPPKRKRAKRNLPTKNCSEIMSECNTDVSQNPEPIIKTEQVESPPPELKPFWHPEDKNTFVPADFSIEETNPPPDTSASKSDTKEGHHSEKECNSKVKRVAKDNWAHPLVDLWQHESYNFKTECAYNQNLASIPPHCAICVIFTPLLDKGSFLSHPYNVPSSSPVKMPTFCYGTSFNKECILDCNSLLENDGSAPLLTCSVCKVSVHAPCYGITELPSEPWTCSRCSANAFDTQCCLCVLRGGALKPTSDGRWAHVVCAILIPEIYFENLITKEPVNVSGITRNRMRLKCKYCIKAHADKDQRGVCIQCFSGKCYLPFHATCGYMAGVIFEANDWPEPINTICTKHAGARRKPVARQFTNVSVGESVLAKHKNHRYYWANVKNKYIEEHYSILFEDNSHSTNTLPEDIVSKDVSIDGPPAINEKVQVKWTDSKIYNGIFKGSQSIDMFVVEFDDGTIQHKERRQIFAADEDLPKEVQSKMSHSSESKALDISGVDGKRLRR